MRISSALPTAAKGLGEHRGVLIITFLFAILPFFFPSISVELYGRAGRAVAFSVAATFADANASALWIRQDKSAVAMSPARWRRIEAYFGFGGFPTVDFDSWKKNKKHCIFFSNQSGKFRWMWNNQEHTCTPCALKHGHTFTHHTRTHTRTHGHIDQICLF